MHKKPEFCPYCNSQTGLQEIINPLTTGIPLFDGKIRIRFLRASGPFRFRLKYRCDDCGYEGKYDDRKNRWEAT